MRNNTFHKLLPKFHGPFKVLDRIGQTAYQLDLPSHAAIHNVFHVSQLKPCPNPVAADVQPLPVAALNHYPKGEPETILDRKMVKRGRMAATKVLVKWKNLPQDQATWEYL